VAEKSRVRDQILGVHPGNGTKLAQQVARKIEDDILARGLEPGFKIGSEPDLMKVHSISRTIFREAVRILEHDGLAFMRRGPGGGLFVVEPSPDVVTHAAALWLRFNRAGLNELFSAREVLESRCAAAAAENIDDAGAERLRSMIALEATLAAGKDAEAYTRQTLAFHEAIAELSNNKVSLLFVLTLCELTPLYGASRAYQRKHVLDEQRAHHAIAEAIVAGDAAGASRRMISHIRASRDFAAEQSAAAEAAGR
jgi:DNA-binding FadR family transcriptional regulator